MYYNYIFPFRLEKEVGIAVAADGSPAAAYVKVELGKCKKAITDEEYQEHHYNLVSDLAKKINCDPKYIVPISGKEFEENTDED